MLRQPAEGRRERFLEATVWVSHVCHASANKPSKVRKLADESMPVNGYRPCGYYEPHIIKGRPFGVRFECVAQTSPERSTLL